MDWQPREECEGNEGVWWEEEEVGVGEGEDKIIRSILTVIYFIFPIVDKYGEHHSCFIAMLIPHCRPGQDLCVYIYK